MKLNDKEKELISKEIENLEKLSSAELVAVVTKRSGNYKFASSLISIFCTFLISYIFVLLSDISTFELIQYQILIFLAFLLFLEKYETLVLKILPKNYKHQKASQNAQEQFYNLGLNRTKTNQAIMFFVSFDEKYVEIITDSEISKKIANSYWENIVDEFIIDVKNNEVSKGYLKAIKSCSSILVERFPILSDDENELSNEVIELR